MACSEPHVHDERDDPETSPLPGLSWDEAFGASFAQSHLQVFAAFEYEVASLLVAQRKIPSSKIEHSSQSTIGFLAFRHLAISNCPTSALTNFGATVPTAPS